MANNINAKIYKDRLSVCKFSKKVNGQIVKKYEPEFRRHGKYSTYDKRSKCYYVVYWGEYKL